MIDIEKALTVFLKDETDVRVVGETPASTTTTWVKLVLLDTDDRTRPVDYLLRYFVQADCYAGSNGPAGQGEAHELASAVRVALLAFAMDDATVTDVEVRGPRRLPDVAFNPARQRYILEAEIHVHS